jgi:hypothetical protein
MKGDQLRRSSRAGIVERIVARSAHKKPRPTKIATNTGGSTVPEPEQRVERQDRAGHREAEAHAQERCGTFAGAQRRAFAC